MTSAPCLFVGALFAFKFKSLFHVAARRFPYHFRERLRDCPSYKVYLVLVDFAGREYNTLI